MIRRLRALSCLAIDVRGHAALGERGGGVEMIDAKSAVLGKRQHPIIPPAVPPLLGMVLTKRVHQPKVCHSPQGVSLSQGEEGLPLPKHRVVDILRLWRDVEVPADDQRIAGTVSKREIAPQPLEPLELVL